MYYFALAVVGVSVECLRRIRSSPFGATLKATRENSQRAAYLGVNVKLYQWAAFVIAGAFTGLAGGLYAVMEKAITPDIIHGPSGEPVFMTIIGGIYSFAGPVVGAGVFVVLNSYLVAWTELWALVLGIILLVMVLMLPGGVVGFINEKARGALSKRGWVRKWVFSR
jgi:branched-chain amino acid transport system permease protein